MNGRTPAAAPRAPPARIDDAAIRLDEVLGEEVHLPRQLLDVEGDAVGQVVRARQLGAALLQRGDERDRLPVERGVLGRRRGAEVRLQRHVPEILEREDAEIAGVAEHGRDRHRHLLEQPRDVGERQLSNVERRRHRATARSTGVGQHDAEVAPVGSVAGQRHDARRLPRETAAIEIRVDPLTLSGGVRYLVAHEPIAGSGNLRISNSPSITLPGCRAYRYRRRRSRSVRTLAPSGTRTPSATMQSCRCAPAPTVTSSHSIVRTRTRGRRDARVRSRKARAFLMSQRQRSVEAVARRADIEE